MVRNKVDWMLENTHFPSGPSMYGINYQHCVHASSVNMFKNKIDKYLAKAGYHRISQVKLRIVRVDSR